MSEKTLLERLDEAGGQGADLSPGDPLSREAAEEIRILTRLMRETWESHEGPETGCLRGCREQICWDEVNDLSSEMIQNPDWKPWMGRKNANKRLVVPKMVWPRKIVLREASCDSCSLYYHRNVA